MKPIMQDFEEQRWCYVCGGTYMLSSHHCVEGNGRRHASERHGLKVLLCIGCHDAAHKTRPELLKQLQMEAQEAFELHYKDKEDVREYFRKEFGLSFL